MRKLLRESGEYAAIASTSAGVYVVETYPDGVQRFVWR
jgi:hypothetical protein